MSELLVNERTLSCGLPVVLVPRPALHRASIALFLRVGSRYETAKDNGISHFLEHMMYRGTPSLASSHAQALAFERLGGMLYAATATDHGLMALSLPPETLERALPLLGEVLTSPRMSSIDVERRIVGEEILEGLDDEGRKVDADDLSRATLYADQPYLFMTTRQSLDAAKRRVHGLQPSVLWYDLRAVWVSN